MKRNLIIILILLAAGVAGFLYFTKDEVGFAKQSPLYRAVPTSAPIFIEASSIEVIPADNSIVQELSGIVDFNKMLNQIASFQEVIKSTPEIQNQLENRPLVLAFDFVGKNVPYPVVISTLKSTKERQSLELLIEKLTGIPQTSYQKRNYNGYTIIDVKDTNGTNKLSFSVAGNLVIISPEDILVEKCIRQLDAPGIMDNQYFQLVRKTVSKQSEIAWFINHRRFPEFWANYLNSKTKKLSNEFGESESVNLKSDVLGLKNYASWSELDLVFHDDRLSLNGITAADDSLNHFLSVLQGQEAVSWNAERILPKSTSFYIGLSFSDHDLFFKRLETFFVHSEAYYNREEKIKKIEQYFRTDSREQIKSLVKDKVIAAITSVSGQSEKNTLFVVNNPSRNDNQQIFEGLLTNYAKQKGIELSSLVSTYNTSEGQVYRIYKFPFPSLPGIWFGESFDFAKAEFAAFRNDLLIFASSREELERYLQDMDSGATLRTDSDFESIRRTLENKANLNVYVNTNKLYSLRQDLFNGEINKGLEANEEIFRKFNTLSWQVVCEDNIYFNSVQLGYQLKPKIEVRATWQLNLDAELAIKPQIVVNHTNKAENEIMVQDVNNQLYLINADGKLVWMAPVSGKIMGAIHQVDYYNNGKLQYLFNTSEKIYLIDREGITVADFPILLKSPATNGVNVFDYNNNNSYRYFVACSDKKVYAYNHEGKIISGWNFEKTTGTVTNPVHHFRVNNKDYIVFKDETQVYIQNRQGETRVNSSAEFSPSENDVVLNTQATPKIVVSSKDGDVYYLYFDGKFAQKKTDKFAPTHSFSVGDINGDGKPEFVFVDENKLLVYDESGDQLFEEEFDDNLQQSVNLYSFSATKQMIGVTNAPENKIYLYEPSGKLYDGFPLSGNTEFSIGKLKDGGPLNLVVGDERGNLLCYQLE